MKKNLSIATSVLFSAILYPNYTEPDNPQVLKLFNEIFKTESNSSWAKTGNDYKVTFSKENTSYSVIFAKTGDIKLICRIISIEQLPITILEKLRITYAFGYILSLHEYAYSNSSSYYLITLVKDRSSILMKYSSDGDYQNMNGISRN